MGHIACLPEAVVSNLRSSIVLSDLAQIVEELVCNSLDAEATQINVCVRPEDSQILVEDNGFGISEDDFELLGERYATSKIHELEDLEGGIQTLGFRGEALSSLADVALLDVTSRARGSPHTFRKILKASKTLYFKRSSLLQDYGTKVVVREIFLNQPVRRKLFCSSHKKVLQSVKERALRLALMHPGVAILVKDMARQEVFRSRSVSSVRRAMLDLFGSDLCSIMKELDFAKGNLRLHGFLSKASHVLSSKTLQFFYVNRRFVHKTPIHKLLNSATNCGMDLQGSHRKKQAFPAFVLNLMCPPSHYDITFEASKTIVEFKDWKMVVLFIEEILEQLWPRHRTYLKEHPSLLCIDNHDEESNIVSTKEPVRQRKSRHVELRTTHSGTMDLSSAELFDEGDHSCVDSLQDDTDLRKAFEEAHSSMLTREIRSRSPRKSLVPLDICIPSKVTTPNEVQGTSPFDINEALGRDGFSWSETPGTRLFGLCYERKGSKRKRLSPQGFIGSSGLSPEPFLIGRYGLTLEPRLIGSNGLSPEPWHDVSVAGISDALVEDEHTRSTSFLCDFGDLDAKNGSGSLGEVNPSRSDREGSDINITKFRKNSESVVGDDPHPVESVADMYQAWVNPLTKVEGRDILDIASNVEHVLVPGSITKEKLQHGRVLQQVDKKFIAVKAQGVLVLVDQHAADERVRLEQLRKEVLESDTKKAVTLLDQPEELTLTPMNQQILETYAEQVQTWGWRFKIASRTLREGLSSGKARNVLLNAVPNILNTNLTTADLNDYLAQLKETHGSSAPPPAVTRILNYKACRGAIMFGDTLLPSECHQLLAHLKQTALCFQCAHGRPTMVPLVSLPALHRCYSPAAAENRFGGAKSVDIRECEVETPDGKQFFKTFRSSTGPPKNICTVWHGLQCLPASLERARSRLQKARDV